MITEQASFAGGGGLLSQYSVAAQVLVSTNVGVSSVVSWGVTMAPMIFIF